MEKKRFGRLARLELPGELTSRCEVLHFERPGTPHTHHESDEIAICVSGSGFVDIASERHRVEPGQYVQIPAGWSHHMIPDPGTVLCMLVGYLQARP